MPLGGYSLLAENNIDSMYKNSIPLVAMVLVFRGWTSHCRRGR